MVTGRQVFLSAAKVPVVKGQVPLVVLSAPLVSLVPPASEYTVVQVV